MTPGSTIASPPKPTLAPTLEELHDLDVDWSVPVLTLWRGEFATD